jgi:hypothetical protein
MERMEKDGKRVETKAEAEVLWRVGGIGGTSST